MDRGYGENASSTAFGRCGGPYMSKDAKKLMKLVQDDINRHRDLYVAVGSVGHE